MNDKTNLLVCLNVYTIKCKDWECKVKKTKKGRVKKSKT